MTTVLSKSEEIKEGDLTSAEISVLMRYAVWHLNDEQKKIYVRSVLIIVIVMHTANRPKVR
jgi:hypothetical protein